MITSRAVLLIFLAFMMSLPVQAQAQQPAQPFRIIGVTFGAAVYDKPLTVIIDVQGGINVTARVYYTVFLNQSQQLGGWRVSQATLTGTIVGPNPIRIFSAAIPDPTYGENLAYNTKIVFYAEASDLLGNVALSCNPSDRWNLDPTEGKSVVVLKDLTPPAITSLQQFPEKPTTDNAVEITAMVHDGLGSGVEKVWLYYSMNDGSPTVTEMHQSPLVKNLYTAKLPGQPRGARVTYYVAMVDRVGNSQRSDSRTFIVSSTPQEASQWESQQLSFLFAVGTVLAFVLLPLTLYAHRRLSRKTRSVQTPIRAKHTTATRIMISPVLISVAKIVYDLWSSPDLALKWIAFAILGVFLLFWSSVDPALNSLIRPLIPFGQHNVYDENPPTMLLAGAGLMGMMAAVTFSLGYYVSLYVAMTSDVSFSNKLATTLMHTAIVLFMAGILLQFLWDIFKNVEISVEPLGAGRQVGAGPSELVAYEGDARE